MRTVIGMAVLLACVLGCAGSSDVVCSQDPATGFERCQGGATEAVVTGTTAAAVWGVKGCTVQGCEPPLRCNEETKLCERVRCNENDACPVGLCCNEETLLCE
jgi:hypothetical protein